MRNTLIITYIRTNKKGLTMKYYTYKDVIRTFTIFILASVAFAIINALLAQGMTNGL